MTEQLDQAREAAKRNKGATTMAEQQLPFRQRLEAAMAAEIRVRIPDTSAPEGYREEWWPMDRVYDVAWAAAADLSTAAGGESHHSNDEQS